MFFKGLLIGFSIAVPVGPIGFLCLRRTLAHGRLTGFLSGLGAATADALYGAIAALGLTAVSAGLTGSQNWLQAGGGLFLLILGLKTAWAQPTVTPGKSGGSNGSLAGAYLSTLLLTLTNPATLLAFVAIFAGLGVGGAAAGNLGAAGLTVGGVFLGSSLWWLLLSFLAGMLRHRLDAAALRDVHIVSGLCIASLGLWQLGQLVWSLFL